MDDEARRRSLSRRDFLSLTAAGLTGTAAASLLAACSQAAPASQPSGAQSQPAAGGAPAKPAGEPVKVGLIQPLTGSVAASGGYVRSGTEIARDWINERGGVLGRPVQLVIEDNKSDPKEAASAAEKLIVSDKVPCIIGCWGSSMTLAALPKVEQYGVPLLVETSSAGAITTSGNPWVFRISPSSSREVAGFARYYDNFKITKADFLNVNTDWGRTSDKEYGDLVASKGGSKGASEFMEQSATDMGAQLTRIQQSGGDTLFLTTAVEQIVLVMKQMQERRMTPQLITTGGSNAPDQLIEQAGAAAEGSYHVLFFMPWFPEAMPNPSLAMSFIEEWKRRGHPMSGITEGFRGHDALLTLTEAIGKAGKAEAGAIKDALWTVQVQGLNGPIKFEKEGPAGKESGQSQPSIFVVQIKGGKVVLPDFAKPS